MDGASVGRVEQFRGYYQHLTLPAGPHVIAVVAPGRDPYPGRHGRAGRVVTERATLSGSGHADAALTGSRSAIHISTVVTSTAKRQRPEPDDEPAPLLTPAVFHILLALADGESHGYGIMQDVERFTNGETRLGPGTLYRSIQRMLVDGLIEELAISLHDETDEDRRRYYRLTPKGLVGRQTRGGAARRSGRCRAASRSAPPTSRQGTRRMTPTPVPEDFHTITPQMAVKGVAAAIDWYTRALGAHELLRNAAPDGTSIMHAELLLGDSRFFVVDEFPDSMVSPSTLGGTTVTMHLYVPDVDALFNRAVEAGATVVMPVADQFWGDRYGILRDPFGHRWSIASRIEDLSPKKLQDRAKAWVKDQETS